jgi:proteasome lid subunit RPN8/RPN11
MLILPHNLFEKICREGETSYPQECCGLLAGNKTADDFVVSAIFPMKNHVASEILDRYRIDPKERSIAEEKIASAGMALLGFYHSHPDHDAYFSKTDLENSEEYQFGEPWLTPTYAYLVLSVKKAKAGDCAAFIIQEGKAKKITVQQ